MPGKITEPTVLWLIRHGEPEFGNCGRIYLGQTCDPPLSETGRKQAVMLKEKLKEKGLSGIYVSPMLRARQTAEMLESDSPIVIAPELIEVFSGEWEGMPFSEIREKYPTWFDFTENGEKTPPGGESDESALARGLSLLNRLAARQGERFALITHSGLGRILLCHLMGIPFYRKRQVPMPYASCTTILYKDGIWSVSLEKELEESQEK